MLWIDERSEFLCEVDCLYNCDLSSFFLVFPEEVREGTDDVVGVESVLIRHSKHLIVLTELWKEIMKRFDCSSSKHFI